MKFEFGQNWKQFSRDVLDERAIQQAREHFNVLFEGIDFNGKRFLDVGFGQGIGLCLAMEKGAECTGLEVDPINLEALQLTLAKFHHTTAPQVMVGSILDPAICASLTAPGKFDIVQSWGVLHHTGNLPLGLRHTASLVAPGGHLVLAIYHRHWTSPLWKAVKLSYNLSPRPLKRIFESVFTGVLGITFRALTGRTTQESARGMDFRTDVIDWIGGYPYEYMTRDEILSNLPPSFRLVRYIPPLVPTGNHQLVVRLDP